MGLKIYIIYFVFPFAIYFSDISFLHVREPYEKLYAENYVASCNGCSHQSNHIEITCSFNFLITYRIKRVGGHVNGLYVNIYDCMFNFELHKVFTILFKHIQHVYCIYGVPYMQIAAIGKICSYNIWHYVASNFLMNRTDFC